MITEIIELLYKYTDKLIDEKYYIELNGILMKYNNIDQDEYNGIKFITVEGAAKKFNTNETTFDFTRAFYYEPENIIYLIPNNLTDDTRIWNNYNLTSQEHYIFTNLVRSVYLFHEFEHLVQKRGKTGLEGMLISDVSSAKGSNEYAISPREHFANLYSYLISYLITKKMNLPKSILSFFIRSVEDTLYNPYLYNEFDTQRNNKDKNEPIIEYYNKTNKHIDIDLDYVNDLDFMDRIIYGFAITHDEFEHFHELYEINGVEPDIILERLDVYSNTDEKYFRSAETDVFQNNRR